MQIHYDSHSPDVRDQVSSVQTMSISSFFFFFYMQKLTILNSQVLTHNDRIIGQNDPTMILYLYFVYYTLWP